MESAIQEYAKRLKLSWIRQHYHDVQSWPPMRNIY